MAVRCPHCQHGVSIKEAKAGRYKPKCPKCGERFELTVPEDPGGEMVARKLPPAAERQAPPSAARQEQAARQETVADADSTGAWTTGAPAAPREAADPNATGAWSSNATLPGESAAAGTNGANSGSSSAWDAHTVGHADQTAAQPSTPSTALTRASMHSDATSPDGAPGSGPLPPDAPSRLGGYQLLRQLGRGGMGAVYLARQLSLDRNVALKVMQPQWASDPTFVARFTREAYAAAQLVHHNVVQIYDIGNERDVNYFSMEFVKGQSLSDLVKRQGKLDVEQAVGYILQAARGLKFAHDQGMIHRDIKPDNLMLNDQGVVKVADLGLVKTPGATDMPPATSGTAAGEMSKLSAITDVTLANIAIGTPAYMSPEQGQNASAVDHRADIYSLGCTLYVMITGRPPFQGTTVMEVLTKHKTEPIVRPEAIVKRVPKELSDIIVKMVAKRPDERYQDLGEVIKALEGFLGLQTAGPFTPKEEHAQTLEECVKQFNAAPAGKLRTAVIAAFAAGTLLLALICAMFSFKLAAGLAGLALMTAVFYFVLSGIRGRTYLFSKTRELVFGSNWTDWLSWAVALLLFVALLLVFQLLWVWVGFLLLAAALAVGFHFVFDRKLADQQRPAIERTEQMLKSMRLNGLEEDALRRFVARYSGDRWEAFYEAMFGYEAKMAARQYSAGEQGRARVKQGVWREPIINWIEARQKARREAKERKHLQKVEQKSLQAKGLSASEARDKAQLAAEAMVTQAAEWKTVADAAAADPAKKRARIKAMLEAAEQAGRAEAKKRPIAQAVLAPLALLLGGKLRFLAGGLLLAGCVFWIQQNHIVSVEELQESAAQAAQGAESLAHLKESGIIERIKAAKPLDVPMLPSSVEGVLSGFHAGLAGLLLIASALFRGWKGALLVVSGVLLAIMGQAFGLP